MANELDDDKFSEFLCDINEEYPGIDVKKLKFLLFDHLEISVLTVEDVSGFDLFNKLHSQGDISYTDVKILLEIAKLTKCQNAIDIINKYIKDIPADSTPRACSCLSSYRKALFKSLDNVGPADLRKVCSFYKLKSLDFVDIWDAVFNLEMQGRLANESILINRFAKLLNEKAKGMLSDFLQAAVEDRPSTSSTTPAVRQPQSTFPTSGGQKSVTTVPSLNMNDEKFRALLIKLSDWYQGRDYLNMLKLLFKDTIERAKLDSCCTVKDLLLGAKDARLFHQTNLRMLMDMIKVTNTLGVLNSIEVLDGLYDDAEVTSFKRYRRNIIQLGNDLSKKESETLGDLYGIARSKYNNSDQWLLIMKLEEEGKISKEKMKNFIEDLKDIGLGHAARKLEEAMAKE